MIPETISTVCRFHQLQAHVLQSFEKTCARRFSTNPDTCRGFAECFWLLQEMREHGIAGHYSTQFMDEITTRRLADQTTARAITTCYNLLEPARVRLSRIAIASGVLSRWPAPTPTHTPSTDQVQDALTLGQEILKGQSWSSWNRSYGSCSAMPVFQYLSGLSSAKRAHLIQVFTTTDKVLSDSENRAENIIPPAPIMDRVLPALTMALWHHLLEHTTLKGTYCPPPVQTELRSLRQQNDFATLRQLAQATAWLYASADGWNRRKLIQALSPRQCQQREQEFWHFMKKYDACHCCD